MDFLSYVERPELAGSTTRLTADQYELRLTGHGVEARKGSARCVYAMGAIRQWWLA